MHTTDLAPWMHTHRFDAGSPAAERGTRAVVWITAGMMIVEIVAGGWFNSMALLADGLHMASHAMAIGLSAVAYAAARRYARDARFAFGTWKVEVLAGFASAILLLGIAALMVVGSIERIVTPKPISYREALFIAAIGLAVNIVCAMILGKAHGHDHQHGDVGEHARREHEHGHHDLNLKSAYVHVIADAATSVLAIVALAGGWIYGWAWLDPAMGLAGALLVGLWSKNLILQTGRVLLDREMDHPVVEEIRAAVESGREGEDTRVADLHVWRVGKTAYACALSVVTHDRNLTATGVRQRLAQHAEVVHATIEIHQCT
ncbi:MAG TPA: CDF family Co(II)/Ni(II) efflux transporter DmeF [Burkholderiales bacterium]|nr:CDF family Co(II)/Ni(II) efflux transporter DmeF [Burkholderiales bacterium]